jgi:hypothetical protein
MNLRSAKEILRCCGPFSDDVAEKDVRSALRAAAKSPDVLAAFERQRELDARVASHLNFAIPEEALAEFEKLTAKLSTPAQRSRVSARDPAFLAVGLAFMAIIGLGVWLLLARMDAFPGLEETTAIAKVGDVSQPAQFEALQAPAGSLGDWFVMQGFDGFQVPQGFAQSEVVGVRVFEFEGTPVAMAAVPENRSFFYVFPSKSLGIEPGEAGNWRIVEYGDGSDERVLAISQMGNFCFMITFAGRQRDMERFLTSRKR